MCPTLRELLEEPERARSLPPESMAAILGELVLLFTRVLLQASTTPRTTQATNPEDPDRLLTVRETAALLSVRSAHVYELIRTRRLPALRVGRYVRVRSHDLQDWIEGQREKEVDIQFQSSLGSPPPMSTSYTRARGRKTR
jgi:excisionase family DNA binding protein